MITKTYRVTNIVWDTDGEQIDDLPLTCIVELDFEDEEEASDADLDELIGNALSDRVEWCVEGFEFEPTN